MYCPPFSQRGFLFLTGTITLSFLIVCGTPGNRTSVLEPPTVGRVTPAIAHPPSAETDTSDNVPLFIGEVMLQAEQYCRIGEFISADSLAREIVSVLGRCDEQAVQDSTLPIEQYMADIVTLYGEMMPDTIAVPEVIASEVLQRRVFKSLDSLIVSSEDSMLVAGYLKRTGISSDMPLTWNSRVRKALLYYLTRNRSTVAAWKIRAGTYLSFMKKMFIDSGLPQDLAYLPLIESGYNPKAYSRAHASGIWQFMRSTGKLYGLRSNYWIDERRDPVRSTEAAIRYLKKLYADFGHWHLVLAAYNCGEKGLSRTIEERGSNDYWNLELPAETMNYVPLYLASLAIAKSPDFTAATGLMNDTVPFDTVSVGDCIDMREIAKGTGVDYDTLKKINPHILHWCTPPDMTGVLLYLPSGFASAFTNFYASLPDEKKVRWYRYKVQSGDNLGSIAGRFRLPVEGIKSVNRLQGTRIVAGNYLFIPIPVGASGYANAQEETVPVLHVSAAADIPAGAHLTVYEVRPGDTVWRLAEIFGVGADQICAWNTLVDARIKVGQILSIYTGNGGGSDRQRQPPSSRPSTANGRHIVRDGDDPYRIARRFSMPLDALCLLNGISPEKPVVYPGDTLLVTGSSEGPTDGAVPDVRRAPVPQPPFGVLAYIVAPGDDLFRIAQNFSTTVAQIRALNGLSGSSAVRCGDTLFLPKPLPPDAGKTGVAMKEIVYYTVKSGDNLWRIARTFGMSVDRLCKYNDLRSTSVLLPGDTVRVLREGEM